MAALQGAAPPPVPVCVHLLLGRGQGALLLIKHIPQVCKLTACGHLLWYSQWQLCHIFPLLWSAWIGSVVHFFAAIKRFNFFFLLTVVSGFNSRVPVL